MKNYSFRQRPIQSLAWLLSLLIHIAVLAAGAVLWRDTPPVHNVSKPSVAVVLLASRSESQRQTTPLLTGKKVLAIPDRRPAEPVAPVKPRRHIEASKNLEPIPVLTHYFVVAELTEVPRLLNDFRTDFQRLVLEALPPTSALLVRLSMSGEVDGIFQVTKDDILPLDEALTSKFAQFRFLPGKRNGEGVPSELRYEISDGAVMPILEAPM